MEKLIFRVKGFFWGFGFSPTFNHSIWLDSLIDKIIYLIDNCEDVKVNIEQYSIIVVTSNTIIELWNENKYYGWLSRGSVNGIKFEKISPSKMYMYKLYIKLKLFKDIPVHKKNFYDIDLISC